MQDGDCHLLKQNCRAEPFVLGILNFFQLRKVPKQDDQKE